MATFEWRANDGAMERFSTADGYLFSCHPSQGSVSNPSLTLVPPVSTKDVDLDDSNKTPNNNNASCFHPAPCDDLSPPNAVDAHKMNGIAIPVSTSAGWSQSPPKLEGVYPSSVAYDLRLRTNNNSTTKTPSSTTASDSLELALSLEYTNPHFEQNETMMVKVATAKTLLQPESGTELALVATQFQEFIPAKNQWMDITADVDYTKTADAVVDAVMKDPNAGQTAGKATVTAQTVELTLGPFSAKARINLTFQAERLYTYDSMSVKTDASDIGSHRILPLWVTLPFAPINNEAGLSKLSVRLQAPPGTSIMPMDQYQHAYQDLKTQESMRATTILAVPELVQQQDGRSVGCQFSWDSLPPRSCGLLAWLTLPNPIEDDSGFDFVHIGRSLEELSCNVNETNKTHAQVVLQVPSEADMASLQAPLPGHGPMGSLWRIHVKMPEEQPRQKPCFILNMNLSDKSGSTGMHVGAGRSTTMRQRFNELAIARFLKRLESIPALVQAGVLRADDVWMDVFLAFDSTAPKASIHRVIFRVSHVLDTIVEVVNAIRANNKDGYASSMLPSIFRHVSALRGITPGGLTDFSVGPSTLAQEFGQWQKEACALTAEATTPCSFVEFDTDGGHNGAAGNFLKSLQNLCEVCDVRNGVVTGFGNWLNQDCATKVARVLGSVPAQLALQIPEPGTEGLDKVFRRGFSSWVSALRQPPSLTVKVSAGAVSFPASLSARKANAVEVLALRRVGERYERLPKFGAPDVSNEAYTKAVIDGAPAGDELILYIVSRFGSASELRDALEIETTVGGSTVSSKALIMTETEATEGNLLAWDWLTMLTGKSGVKGFQLAPLMATSLCSRLEDELSFRFNIASPSGRTSYLGRCKTVANRAPIDPAHQPTAPKPPLKVPSSQQFELQQNFAASAVPSPSRRRRESRRMGDVVRRRSCQVVAAPTKMAKMAPFVSAQKSSTQGGASPKFHAQTLGSSLAKKHYPEPQKTNDPSWMDALAVPVGSSLPLSKQDYDDLKRAIREIVHARDRLAGNPSVNFICDICKRQFSPGDARFHCFDCRDFDACANCCEGHTLPFHRLALIAPTASTRPAPIISAEDPLVDALLQPMPGVVPTAVATWVSQPPATDQTVEWNKNRLRRFLVAVLHWWPLFRFTCGFRDKLPEVVTGDLTLTIARCTSTDFGDVDDLLKTVTVVIDSLERQDGGLLHDKFQLESRLIW